MSLWDTAQAPQWIRSGPVPKLSYAGWTGSQRLMDISD